MIDTSSQSKCGQSDNLFVAGFIGSPKMNFFDAKVDQGNVQINDGGNFASGDSNISNNVVLEIRPEYLEPTEKSKAFISGREELVEQLGEYEQAIGICPVVSRYRKANFLL